ncbi:spore germination protein [Paenibacillus xerothermodurans]|uniref:Spore germination protein n=1 Tax=Paenibacillus xerothermodurans TaxID=1977292 RepID=A0A2W1P2M2_PAEXE|nr:spore germination protein [Paenibacillus xerothermodurans]PZE21378.1 spore germination protein [Paenibacillus xerothermodurans]
MGNWYGKWGKSNSDSVTDPVAAASPEAGLQSVAEAEQPLSADLDANLQYLKLRFKDCSDVVFRNVVVEYDVRATVIFVDGLVNTDQISDHALRPLLYDAVNARPDNMPDPPPLEETQISLSQVSRASNYNDVIRDIMGGNAALFIDGYAEAIILSVPGGERRGVSDPTTENVIRGPREGFTDALRPNTALVRARLRTPALKMVPFVIGEKTNTNVVLAYMDGLADPAVIEEATKRLHAIKLDGILESGYIEEFIEDNPYSLFPQLQYTERPDSIAAHLLEGRFAIFTEGTPFVLVAPTVIWQLFQASEDYYERYHITNFIRWLRYIFGFIALFLPSIYIATTTFHHDMLPTTLTLSIAAAREAIPFPALVEALIMEISFEALREAGIRLPKAVGAALSILGALVIGQSAVEAGIVSAPMVMVVAVTGIASFAIPKFNLAISIRLLRFPMMFLAGLFGLYGMVLGTVMLMAHLCSLRSFGVPYLAGLAPYKREARDDILARVPWWDMEKRPASISRRNRRRLSEARKPRPDPTRKW